MNCPKCNQDICIKRGKRKGVQRYFCKRCKLSFQSVYKYTAYQKKINSQLITLLKEGCGVRSISRILKISVGTVLSRIIIISNQIKPKDFNVLGCVYEVDEMWSYIGNKTNVTWITYAIEQQTKTVISFYVGKKTKDTIRPILDKVLSKLPKRIYTELNIYPSLIPVTIHRTIKYRTNRIERNNLTLRTHIKRLSRKTICFSKSQKYLEAHLAIYFWGIAKLQC